MTAKLLHTKLLVLLEHWREIPATNNILDEDLLKVLYQSQKIVPAETMECLFTLAKPFYEVFRQAKTGNIAVGKQALKRAKIIRSKFELNNHEQNLLKILTYPNISYLKYKEDKYKTAKWYVKRAINILHLYLQEEPLLGLCLQIQEMNYSTLCIKSLDYNRGIKISVANIHYSLKCLYTLHEQKGIAEYAKSEEYTLYKDSLRMNLKSFAGSLYRLLKTRQTNTHFKTKSERELIREIVRLSEFEAILN